MTTKKYILKPGRHQFAPGSPATHHNDNLSDEEAGWYLNKYPHIASQFETIPGTIYSACRVSDKESPQPISEISKTSVESLNEITPTESVESTPLIGEIKQQQQ